MVILKQQPRKKKATRQPGIKYSGHRDFEVGIQHIVDALVASGHTSLDKQARALGVNRSTAWTIVKAKHKLGRLSAKTSRRMLENPALPISVRVVVQQYLKERSVQRALSRAGRGRATA